MPEIGLKKLLTIDKEALGVAYRGWIEEAMKEETCREPSCSESEAVGSKNFVERIKEELGFRAIGRKVHEKFHADMNVLRESAGSYSYDSDIKNGLLRDRNGMLWEIFPE